MARKIDITDKLDFEKSPALIIKDKEYVINADANTMMKIMAITESGEEMSNKTLIECYELIFPEKTRKELSKLSLSIKDLSTLIEAAMDLATGDDEESEGEK